MSAFFGTFVVKVVEMIAIAAVAFCGIITGKKIRDSKDRKNK